MTDPATTRRPPEATPEATPEHFPFSSDYTRRLDRLSLRIYFQLCSWTNPIWHLLDKSARTLLDVGCGPAESTEILNLRRRLRSVGVDVWTPYLRHCKARQIHDVNVRADVRQLPFREKSFDVVICLQVIEHLSRPDAERLLERLERVARRQVIVTTPVGYMPHPEVDCNPYQAHLSGWTENDFASHGYSVTRQGLVRLYGPDGLVHRLRSGPARKSVLAIGWLFELACLLFPPTQRVADYYLVASKNLPFVREGHRNSTKHSS